MQVMDEFKERAARIEKLEKKMAGNNAAQTAHKDEISQLRDSWLPPLQEIIDKVNQQFSSYFRQMKCAGEVTLRVPPNPVSEPLLYSIILRNTLQYSIILCNTLQYSIILCNTIQYSIILCNTIQYSIILCNAIQYSIILCNTIQYNIILSVLGIVY